MGRNDRPTPLFPMLSLVLNGLALLTPVPQTQQAQHASTSGAINRRALIGGLGGVLIAGVPALASADALTNMAKDIKKDETQLSKSRVALNKATASYEADKKKAAAKGLVGVDCDDELCTKQKVGLETIASLKQQVKAEEASKKQLMSTINRDISKEEMQGIADGVF